jgi:hypothetical protein
MVVEDYRGMTAAEILKETGHARTDNKLRHFTGPSPSIPKKKMDGS